MVLTLSNAVSAQNYQEDMEKIRTAYTNKYHSYSIKYLYYPFDTVKRVTDSILGTCVADKGLWHYKIRGSAGLVEYLKNEKYFVEVNHSDKVIIIGNSSVAKGDLWNINKVDSMLRLPSSKIIYHDKGNEGEYTLTFNNGSWSKLKIVFNKERLTLDEIWLYSAAKGKIYGEPYNKPAIGIFFDSYATSVPSKDDFTEKKYVQETAHGNFESVGNFKGYKVLDYVNKRT